MEIETIRHLYQVPKTYINVKSVLKRINETMGWLPVNMLHIDNMVNIFPVLCHTLLTVGLAKSKDDLLSKLFRICGVFNRMYPGQESKLSQLCMQLKIDQSGLIPNQPIAYTAPKWKDILDMLDDQIKNNQSKFAKIVCICFKHGYVLRIGEIFNTSLFHTEKYNYLDLEGMLWTIRIQKNKGVRSFAVSKEFVNELRPFLDHSTYLIHKNNYETYSTHSLAIIGLSCLPSNSELRNSYETWNWETSNRSRQERLDWSINVLGHDEHTVNKYYLEQKIEQAIVNAKPRPKIIWRYRK